MIEELQHEGDTPGTPNGDTPMMEGPDVDDRGGLPLNEAAMALGISRKALLGRISRNEVEAWKVETKFGPQWRVKVETGDTQGTPLSAPEVHPNGAHATMEGTPSAELAAAERRAWETEKSLLQEKWDTERVMLQEKVEALEKDKDWLQGQVAQRAAELERAQILQMQAQRKVTELEEKMAMMLPAPVVESEVAPAEAAPEEPAQQTVPRPWWKFWG